MFCPLSHNKDYMPTKAPEEYKCWNRQEEVIGHEGRKNNNRKEKGEGEKEEEEREKKKDNCGRFAVTSEICN